jgi:iron complex transport system substrate-binding protein
MVIRYLLLLLAGFLFLFPAGCKQPASDPHYSCGRVISLSPSITETLYALGLEGHLAGVTRFCRYPPEAREKPSVGGYLDPNLEAIVRLKPDLILLRKEQTDFQAVLANARLPTLAVEHRTVPGILESFRRIGAVCHRQPEAERLVASLNAEIERVVKKTRTVFRRPRVMIAVDRDVRRNTVRQVYIAGRDGFYDWMIAQAGGESVAKAFPGFLQVSPEGILRLNPDIIIEIMPGRAQSGLTRDALIRQWRNLARVPAVRNHRVYIFDEPYMVIPGPRFVNALKRFVQVIHPELAVRE